MAKRSENDVGNEYGATEGLSADAVRERGLDGDDDLVTEPDGNVEGDRVESVAETALELAALMRDCSVEAVDELQVQARAAVRRHPLSSLAMAAGAGAALMCMMRGHRRHH